MCKISHRGRFPHTVVGLPTLARGVCYHVLEYSCQPRKRYASIHMEDVCIHGCILSVCSEEERELQRKVGINNFGDITQLLATASRALVDVLRINTVIRGTSNLLGVTMAERIHMYSGIAIQGLPRRGATDKHMHRYGCRNACS